MIPLKLKSMKLLTAVLILICMSQVYILYNSSYYRGLGQISFFDKSTASTTYQQLLKIGESQNLRKLPLSQRCDSYFDQLYLLDENWNIGEIKELEYSFDVHDELKYYLKAYEELEEQYKKEEKPIDQEMAKQVFQKLKLSVDTNLLIEERLKNSVGHLRIYGTCYVKHENFREHSRCLDIESRLFPWMTFESPIFERWDGTVLNEFPQMSKYYKYKGMGKVRKQLQTPADSCFIYNFRNQLNGKGIVLSIADQLVDELINLIKVLRFMRNDLPIQFVHKGDLSFESKKKLTDICRNDIHLKNSYVIDFAPQEVWFVDANRCFLPAYYHNFDHFANKWIAVIFNSFEDMIFMDTDSVPFIKPEEFFELGEYQKKGLFFFKDRTSLTPIPEQFKQLYLKMFPTELELSLFEIATASEKTFSNRLLAHKLRHSMESGVVVMNRRKKLLGILVAVHIQFWGPLTQHIHGEKEIFWLSQSIAGNEDYEFNANSAGAVGVLEPESGKFPEHVVGIQPAHVAGDNQTLLWINSGVKNCKKEESLDYDFNALPHWKDKFSSKTQLKEFYDSAIDIKSVVIPPETYKKWPNDQEAPEEGWQQRVDYGCAGYMWAAYSKVGGSKITDQETFGQVVKFDQEQMSYYNKIAKVWITDME